MDYEQKYKEALERARQIQNTPYTAHWDVMKEVVEAVFPELAKSEDEKMLENAIFSINHESVIEGLKCRGINYSLDASARLMENLINWLKSLKDRVQPQPKQEWSEEDEERLQSCLNILQAKGLMGVTDTVNSKWLNSLKERYTWKPSDEQMDMLKIAVSTSNSIVLDSLYNDLMKLKE